MAAICRGLALGLTVLGASSCSARSDEESVHQAVWEYQLSAYDRSIAGRTVCIGLVDSLNSPKFQDPPPHIVQRLNADTVRVRPASQCGPGRPLGFMLGPVTFEGRSEALVEGTSVEGFYRYHLESPHGRWRVREGVMTAVY